ncbi:hypothetical protein LTR37_018654 [Vermiconidia calcicola]|uniref:Uncharacterized protein n=1 Tax=Vermiconidia calcicola TaxID=1690605 RepID=A0ACC3MI22_9PEZI|nr:hypothetical protein LTR37_018654 [Vermiconidia calcicola]
MRFSTFALAGLSAYASAQRTTAIPATEQLASMAAEASRDNADAAATMAGQVSSWVAGQTLSGEAAAQAAHNSDVLQSALSDISALQGTIKSAEASVLRDASMQAASITAALATATDASALNSLSDRLESQTEKIGSVLNSATRGGTRQTDSAASGSAGASASGSAAASASPGLAAATGVPLAGAAIGCGLLAIVGLL